MAATELQPGVVLALVHRERQAGLEHEVRMLAEIVVGRGLAGLDGAVLHRVGNLQTGDDFARRERTDLELAVRHFADDLGEEFGAAVERVERLGKARRQTPLNFRHALGNGRCGHRRRRRNTRGTHACGLDELPALHIPLPPWLPSWPPSAAATLACVNGFEKRPHAGKSLNICNVGQPRAPKRATKKPR